MAIVMLIIVLPCSHSDQLVQIHNTGLLMDANPSGNFTDIASGSTLDMHF